MITKIVIVEHNSYDIELIQQELKKGTVNFIVEIVNTEIDYKKALQVFKPDIILSNYTFPNFAGDTAFKIKQKMAPQIPFIFVTESIGEEKIIKLIKNGVTDFVFKERLDNLTTIVTRALQEAARTELKEINRQSEEKKSEELWPNEPKYYSLIESSMDAILLTIKDGEILAANAAACEIFKMTPEELCNSGRMDIVDMTDPRLRPLLEERERKGRAKGEITCKRKDGTRFPAEITSVVFTDAYGQEKTSMTIRDITERKQAEEKQIVTSNALQQALNNLNEILDSSIDIICTIDEEGQFVHVSAASERILGYKPEELKRRPYLDFVLEEDVEETLNTAIQIMDGKSVTMFQNRYRHKDGSIVPLLWSAKWDDKDKLTYCIAKDATEKKSLEKAFEIERQRFHDLYLQAPSCMGILKGPEHIYEMANPLYLQLIGKKDIIGKSVKEALPEVEAQGVLEFLDKVYTTGETFYANEMLIQFDHDPNGTGKLVDSYLNFICQAHKNNEGQIDGIFFFAIDVTEQVVSRKKIEESEKKYRQIVETAQEGIWMADENNKTTFVNNKLCEILEYSMEEMIGKDIDFFIEDERKHISTKIMKNIEEGYATQVQSKYISKKGKIIWAHVSANPLFDEAGLYKGALAMVTDITETKNAELKLEQQNEELIKTNFELDRFVYSVSHDLRSPLTSILGLISFIEEETEEPDTLLHAEMIQSRIHRLDDFIKNILSYSRNNRTQFEAENILVQETVTNIVDSLNNMKEAEGIRFEIDVHEQYPFYSDRQSLKTVLENLVSNAIKFHSQDPSGRYIKITGHSDADNLYLSIADNGIGIDPLYHDKIFDMFFRLSGKVDGSGIGLYIVKEIIEKLNGTIQVHSEDGGGTVFTIKIKNLKP